MLFPSYHPAPLCTQPIGPPQTKHLAESLFQLAGFLAISTPPLNDHATRPFGKKVLASNPLPSRFRPLESERPSTSTRRPSSVSRRGFSKRVRGRDEDFVEEMWHRSLFERLGNKSSLLPIAFGRKAPYLRWGIHSKRLGCPPSIVV